MIQDQCMLFLSNGYGEDSIAATIMKELPPQRVVAFPLVGDGEAYKREGILEVVQVPGSLSLPSEGIGNLMNLRGLFRDMRAGLFSRILKQITLLRDLRERVALAVAVGDLYPVILSLFFLRRPVVFVGTAKSNHVVPYSRGEKFLMRRCRLVFARDRETALSLARDGVRARFVGNAMMDSLGEEGDLIPPFPGLTIALLPGSRSTAPENLLLQLRACLLAGNRLSTELAGCTPPGVQPGAPEPSVTGEASLLPPLLRGDLRPHLRRDPREPAQGELGKPVRLLVALPYTASPDLFLRKISGTGQWEVRSFPGEKGIVASCKGKNAPSLEFVTGALGQVLRCSNLVLGQAGTANEQAAGLGKPVVAFDSFSGRRLGWYRWRQKRLLGDAVCVVREDPELLAGEMVAILKDPARYRMMSLAGRERMGPPGGARQMGVEMMRILEEAVQQIEHEAGRV